MYYTFSPQQLSAFLGLMAGDVTPLLWLICLQEKPVSACGCSRLWKSTSSQRIRGQASWAASRNPGEDGKNKLESWNVHLVCSLRHLLLTPLSLCVPMWIQPVWDGAAAVHMQWTHLPWDGAFWNNYPTWQNSCTQHVWYCLNIYGFSVSDLR